MVLAFTKNMAETTRDRYVSSSHELWKALVNFSFLCPPDQLEEEITALAKRTKATPSSIKRKVEAIRYCKNTGMSSREVIEAGQSSTLSKYRNRNGHEEHESQTFIRWRVSVGLARAIKPDPDKPEEVESLQSRFIRVLKIKTHEELWEFIHADYANISDEELYNRGGMGHRHDKQRRR